MKTFVRHTIHFLLAATLFTWLMLWLLGGTGLLRNVTYQLGHDDRLYTKVHEADTAGPVDVLFLGSSHAYRTFDPRIFAQRGLRTFNLGSSNQTPMQTEVLLHKLLDSLNPRLVVFEVHPDIMQHDGVEAAIYQLSNVPPTWDMIPMALRTRNMRVVATAAYALPHNLLSPAYKHFKEPKDQYVAGGFVEHEPAHFSPTPQPPTEINPLPEQLSALHRCTRYLANRQVPYILLEVPDTKCLLSSYTNLPVFQKEMSDYGKFYFKIPPTLDDSLHYYDESHLNQTGAEMYCEYLCDSIIIPIISAL